MSLYGCRSPRGGGGGGANRTSGVIRAGEQSLRRYDVLKRLSLFLKGYEGDHHREILRLNSYVSLYGTVLARIFI